MTSTSITTPLFVLLSLLFIKSLNGTSLLNFCDSQIDVTFIVDQSSSLKDEDPWDKPDHTWNLVKSFVKGLISKLPVSENEVQVAMVKYSTTARVEWGLNRYQYVDQLQQAVDGLNCEGGNTNTAEALREAYYKVYLYETRQNVRNVIIILTDGLSTLETQSIPDEVENLKSIPNTEIYAVAIGKYYDETELKLLVDGEFGKYLIYVADYENLVDFEDILAHRVCNLPDPPPPNDPKCNRVMDLTFVIDSSGSIEQDNFEQLKRFLVTIVSQLEVGPDDTRVGAVTFSDNAVLEFQLGDYLDNSQLHRQLMSIRFENGNTNTSGGIRAAVQQIFSGNPGDRPDVQNVMIIVTDGESTVEKNKTILEANTAKLRGIQMYVIGVTDQVNEQELHQIVSKPIREHYFDSTHIFYLNSILINLIKNICVDGNG